MNLPAFLKSMETVVTGSQERRTRSATKVKTPKPGKIRAQGAEPEELAPTAESAAR
jgi:hypothetical protein